MGLRASSFQNHPEPFCSFLRWSCVTLLADLIAHVTHSAFNTVTDTFAGGDLPRAIDAQHPISTVNGFVAPPGTPTDGN
jgi:hypothetical protein